MNAILILSIIIRLVAFIVALILLRKTRDWRMGFLALTLFLMGAYQSLALGEIVRATGEVTFPIAKELTGLAISILALLTVLGLAALLARHRKEQRALRESHSLLQAIIESTPDAVFVKDLEGRYVMINSAGARFLEKAVEEVIGQDDTALFSPDTASQIMETDRKVRDSGEFRMYEETSTAMGVTRTYLARKGPWWDNNGNVIGLIGIATDITEGKQAEEELRASQERFSKAFYSSPYPMSIIRLRDNRFIYTNDNVVRMTGYRREEIIGHTALELNVWVDTGDRKEILRLLKEQGRVHQKDIKFRTKSGQVREGLFSAETIEVDGEPCLLTTTNDITERKRAEDALRRHAERLRALREMDQAILAARSPEEIAEVALSHLRQLLPAQGAVSVVFAFEEDEAKVLAVNADIRVSVRPGARLPIARFNRERFEKLRQGETVVIGDVEELSRVSPPIEEVRAEGVRSYVGVPLMAQGKLVGALGFGANSPQAFSESEIDLMEEVAEVLAIAIQQSRLFKAERRARRIAETLQSANLALSRTLQLDQVLEVFLTLMRELIPYDSASVMLRETETCMMVRAVRGYEKWTDPEKIRSFVFDAETNPIIREMLQSRRAVLIPDTRKHAGWERPAGSDHVLSWIGAPLVAGGQVIGLYSIDRYELEPFTEKQVVLAEAMAGQAAVAIENARLYEQTQRHAEELEQRVAERTIELQERLAEVERLNATMVNLLEDLQATHRDLEATTSALRESKDEMEAFAYSVSHDLRAPLRAMKGLTIALLEDYTDRLDETGRDFARRIANASQQMDNLIQDLLAYSRVVRAELRPQPVSLYATVKEVLSQMEEKDGQIIVEGPLPEVAGHPAILTQVVSNLIYNAVKFVEPGVRPFVRVRAEDRGAFARLWVEDNGIGISPEYHERIFRVFERLHGAETYHGTGIGLAIVKKGVERMGGQVGIESALSEGSRFWVELPKAKSSGG